MKNLDKELLMDGKNKNRSGYKKTKVGWIPEDWECVRLGRVFERRNARGTEGIPVFSVTQDRGLIGRDVLDRRVETKLSPEDSLLVEPGDIAYNMMRMWQGAVDVCREPCVVSPAYVVCRPRVDRASSTFMLLFFKSPIGLYKLWSYSYGLVDDRLRLYFKDFRLVPAPLPSLLEQNAIAGVLECWDNAIRNYEKKIEKKRNIKKGLMQRLLSGKQRLPGFSGEWKDVELGTLGVTYPGLAGKTQHDFGGGKPFIPYMNIYSNSSVCVNALGYVIVEEGERQNKVQYGDLFFTTSSETPEEVGVSSVLLNNMEELYLNSFCFGFRLHDFEILNLEFSQYYFRGADFRKSMFRIAQGASRYNLSKKYFLQTQIRIPGDIEEQRMIARFMSTTDSEIEKMEQKLALLKDQKKFLLNYLVTGTIRLPQFRGGTASNSTDGENI